MTSGSEIGITETLETFDPQWAVLGAVSSISDGVVDFTNSEVGGTAVTKALVVLMEMTMAQRPKGTWTQTI